MVTKIPTPGCFINTRIMRDNFKRHMAAEAEAERRALKHIVYNMTVPVRARIQAQLKLAVMPNYTRMNQTKNRCVVSGKGRAVLSEFKMSRHQFRMAAQNGELPGVKRATW
ncbi:mitochondrial 37S ribosomal protein uS14m [Lipomyces chichibuensis]|uniref:mitochondrial 37S ribosomal protein uS14m n=1 Tax=Lipomyces chichibuensis TaxID=1546026 RepID=UPI0033434CAC